jgi:hypothetical protein
MFNVEEKIKRWLEPSYFGLLLLTSSFITGFFSYAYSVASHGGGAFQTADWLINYGGGFVRRGLFGEFLLKVSPNSTFGLILLVCIQSFLYFSIFLYFAYVLLSRRASWSLTILICSPAGVCFYGWDLGAFGRKEVIGYFVLLLLSLRLGIKERELAARSLLVLSFLIWIFGILSWEPMALMLPFVLVILNAYNSGGLRTTEGKLAQISFSLTGAFGLVISMINKGNPEQASQICDQLRVNGYQGTKLCSGAVNAIGWTSKFTLQSVYDSFPLYFWFLPLFALSIYPLILSRALVGFEWFAFISFLTIFPLFVVVNDYGRWFSMYYTSLLITLIACNRLEINLTSHMNSKLFGLIFLLSWNIPHWANQKSHFLFNGAIFTPIKVFKNSYLTFNLVYGCALLLGCLMCLRLSKRRLKMNQR